MPEIYEYWLIEQCISAVCLCLCVDRWVHVRDWNECGNESQGHGKRTLLHTQRGRTWPRRRPWPIYLRREWLRVTRWRPNFHFISHHSPPRNATPSGGFNGRPLVQWPTRSVGGWVLEAPGARGPGRLNFGLQLQSPDCNLNWIYDLFQLETSTLIRRSVLSEF